jgi:hypothetical protein
MADIIIDSDSGKLKAGGDQDLEIYNDGSHSYIKNTVDDQTIVLATSTGGATTTAVTVDGSNDVTMVGNIIMADDTSIGIADDAERIEFDGAGDISLLGANVGIGTVSPNITGFTKALTIDGGSAASSGLELAKNGTVKGALFVDGGDDELTLAQVAPEKLYFNTGGTGTSYRRMTIDSSGNVGIGKTPEAWTSFNKILEVGDAYNIANASGQTYVSNNSYYDGSYRAIVSGYGTYIQHSITGSGIIFGTTSDTKEEDVAFTGRAERMRIDSAGDVTIQTGDLIMGTSGKGISFAATANAGGMTSEILDDYEEGTFSPTLVDDSDVEPNTWGDYIQRYGYYTKIGDVVHIQAKMRPRNLTNMNTAAAFKIANLPFPISSANSYYPAFAIGGWGGTAWGSNYACIVGVNNTSYINVYVTDGDTSTIMTLATFSANGDVQFSGTYHT